MVLGFRQRLSDHRHQCGVCSARPCEWGLIGRRSGFPFVGTNFAWTLSCQDTKASLKLMPNPDRQPEMSSPAADGSPDPESIVIWLRGLSDAEFEELSEAIAHRDTETLDRFDTRFKAFLDRSG